MLVLTRRQYEKIHIGHDITITVVQARNGRVRLGIDAPRDVKVLRDECKEKEADNAAPANS